MDKNRIIDELEQLTRQAKKKHSFMPQIIWALVILAIAIGLSQYYLLTPQHAVSRQKRTVPPLIQVVTARPTSVEHSFQAMGTVIPDKEVELTPRVSGQLISVAPQFTRGGHFKEGETLATVDPQDYRLALVQLEGEEAKAQAELNLEMGRQLVAAKEFELLGQKVTKKQKELMLRIPQLNAAKASLQAIRARKKIAEEDLANTRIDVPFPSILVEKRADLGSRVSPAKTIARLVGSESFLIRIAIPQQQLRWISANGENASSIQICSDTGCRLGKVTHVASQLEKGSHLAVIYAKVKDPLCLKAENADKPKLLLESFVNVKIIGAVLQGVIAVSRNHLAENDSVLILSKNGKIISRKVDIIARNDNQIFISSGIEEGEHIVVAERSSRSKNTTTSNKKL